MPLLNKNVTEHLLIDNTRPKTGHCIVRFGQKIMTGHEPKKPDSPVKKLDTWQPYVQLC